MADEAISAVNPSTEIKNVECEIRALKKQLHAIEEQIRSKTVKLSTV